MSRISDNANAHHTVKILRELPENLRPSEQKLGAFLASRRNTVEPLSPMELTANLYEYQKTGLDWLVSRYDKGLGGVLADDMGLGKTLQVIALIIEKLRHNQAQHVLVIVPNSLIANWLLEFKKFTVGITPYVHWGPERVGFRDELMKFDVVITTYSTVVNDVSLFEGLFFDIAVFDEASLVKNPDSLRTKALEQLSYGCGVAITGTPFENSMMDLWSITNLVSPAFLGQKETFRENYAANGVANLSTKDIEKVEAKIRPLLLRRMKADVLTELPERLDIYKPLTMNEFERQDYDEIEEKIRRNKDDKEGAFALISHLRKFSAHPLLSSDNIAASSFKDLIKESAKFSFLASALKKIVTLNEKALIFANHVDLLDKFSSSFREELGVECFKIDGTTPAEHRQAEIDKFSSIDNSALMFLNPLTAGMGLNITSANHVFHYSRQWNPALEEQATGRAYRNGQSRNVNIYFLYYHDSIEQTIHDRLAIKSEVAGGVIRKTKLPGNETELIFELI